MVNKKLPTTDAGLYSLHLYVDNPQVILSAQQGSSVATYSYNWLSVCTGSARLGSSGEAGKSLQVTAPGNPVKEKTLEVDIKGVEGQAIQLEVVNLQGHVLYQQRIEQASFQERMSINTDTLPGSFMLQVHTLSQRQTIKALKP